MTGTDTDTRRSLGLKKRSNLTASPARFRKPRVSRSALSTPRRVSPASAEAASRTDAFASRPDSRASSLASSHFWPAQSAKQVIVQFHCKMI